jgi:hypothetical protein
MRKANVAIVALTALLLSGVIAGAVTLAASMPTAKSEVREQRSVKSIHQAGRSRPR